MIVNKITTGFVVQKYDTLKDQWVSQQFIAGSTVDYENDRGETVDPEIMGDPEPYLPFEMVQPMSEQSTAKCAYCGSGLLNEDDDCQKCGL